MEKQVVAENVGIRTIGRQLLEAGKLNLLDADRIVKTQKEYNLRFGDAAIKLGLVSEEDISKVISQQFNYEILSREDKSVDSNLVAAFNVYGEEVESLRALRSQLSLRWFAENKFLVVTAPTGNCGASFVSANLAILFSQLGQKTLLIDGNMHRPAQKGNFKLNKKTGLSDILASRVTVKEAISQVEGLTNLHILGSGTEAPNPSDLIGRGRFASLMSSVEEEYEIVIVDSPPALEYCDAQYFISVIRGGVIVTKQNMTTISELEQTKNRFVVTGNEPVGVVLNNFK